MDNFTLAGMFASLFQFFDTWQDDPYAKLAVAILVLVVFPVLIAIYHHRNNRERNAERNAEKHHANMERRARRLGMLPHKRSNLPD